MPPSVNFPTVIRPSTLVSALLAVLCAALPHSASADALNGSPLRLPLGTVFKGQEKFDRLVRQAVDGNWRALPLGERTARVGRALVGTPYANYTLEIHDRIEAPSANFNGLDCWTFYEISLGFARMLRVKSGDYRPEDLLAMIEIERYRGGRCDGNYLSRMHFLEEVFADNARRGLSEDPNRALGGVRITRNIKEMTAMWKSYRYLRNNRDLIPRMGEIERRVSALPVYHVPKNRVAGIESELRTGDVVAITSTWHGTYTHHVGIIVREGKTARFLHATSDRSKGRQVVLDRRISQYLANSSKSAGILVYRPRDL